jgi:hypothetical protein
LSSAHSSRRSFCLFCTTARPFDLARKRDHEGSSSTDHLSRVLVRPQFLEETGWKNHSESRDSIFQYANRTKLHLFDYLASQVILFEDFNLLMGANSGSHSYWWNWYDIRDRLLDDYDKKNANVFFVDVSGGKGHDLQAFHERFGANSLGDLVLQDTSQLIAGI